jgi:hypothetical protein
MPLFRLREPISVSHREYGSNHSQWPVPFRKEARAALPVLAKSVNMPSIPARKNAKKFGRRITLVETGKILLLITENIAVHEQPGLVCIGDKVVDLIGLVNHLSHLVIDVIAIDQLHYLGIEAGRAHVFQKALDAK